MSSKRSAVRTAAVTPVLACALLLTAGCGGGDGGADDGAGVPETATGTVEQLAGKAGCGKPNLQIDAEELRQGRCGTGDGRYVLATFATHQGQQDWLSEAEGYGGTYLVGPKWVAVGSPKVVESLRGKLGGDIETGASHGPAHGGGSGGASEESPEGSHGDAHQGGHRDSHG
ncbi:hypothetical protein LIX60_24010 [Streptomyces sp. S07_1.15]|uniref:hypothetical protein n=1 Tax=Streptomyces sp. S07_1.15 TaxID=2873925 RepID=UPI001D148A1C|nr:hypothetical protein [Streptomyces sp. S07_1.15]MCC3654468.1 hypothetical protein [Streptomyces sp. S07_1.15]